MRAKDYPKEYAQIFQKALKEPVTLIFTKHEKATAFRVELYKFRYAVRDELPATKDQYTNLMLIKLSIKNNTLTLTTKKSKFKEKINGS